MLAEYVSMYGRTCQQR